MSTSAKMRSEEIYDLGYAIPGYDINNSVRLWRWRDQCCRLSCNAVQVLHLDGLDFEVAKWSDVKHAAMLLQAQIDFANSDGSDA